MFGQKKIGSAAALVALVQLCPAPFLLAIPEAVTAGLGGATAVIGATAGVVGDVQNAHHNSRSVPVFRVPKTRRQGQNELAWKECHDQLSSAHVTFSGPSAGNVLVKGVPSACMTLVTVITGKYDEGNPIAEGSDSIMFQNLSNDDISQIESALKAHSKI
ncbi:uncharacterized protein F4807DRAFT_461048 [Annulohypoxylon truncatum]|uniref:uncharacterized protein n=1 Tax=Annulohypoxylon truncatum TaxID=327061 RepID=UPI0020084330|nr:uncharacterized protein F4807DRAFT_461048 [Annulohypoxylon truncatum]KAI1208925.1 hypothetical protein F4807DRAFT_461048 [Annulohypoxylon truncatum]